MLLAATMVPLESVLGWIFAILGVIIISIIAGILLIESDFESTACAKSVFIIVCAVIMIIGGTVTITQYCGGGV